jgi:hypothetical protein
MTDGDRTERRQSLDGSTPFVGTNPSDQESPEAGGKLTSWTANDRARSAGADTADASAHRQRR